MNNKLALGKIALGLLFASFYTACDESTTENITQVNQVGMDVVSAEKDLPECTAENEGAQAFVKGESSARVCSDEKWISLSGKIDTVYVQGGKDTVVVKGGKDTVYVKGEDYSCSTEELADKSGLKIICNGDSIGVVLNGAKGEKGDVGEPGSAGAAGVGCSVEDVADTARIIICGEDTTFIQLEDSEEGLTETPSVTDGAYKSFYLKGSNVYVYELSEGRTLQQTSDVFFSELVRDDGFYKFQARDLASQYAMIVIDGFYNNVVTGKVSNTRIVLKAIVDMRKYSSVNVNVISHLELERASKLTKLDGYTFKKGERQARREVMQLFHMDTTGMGETVTLNMFAADEGCSKLLALTILLQGDRSEAEFKELLTEIADDITKDGVWNDTDKKRELAEWAKEADLSGRLDEIRERIVKGSDVELPDFIKYIRNFWQKELSN